MGLKRGFLLLVLALWASPLRAQAPPAVVTASLTSGVCTAEGATSAGCVTLNVAGQASLGIQVTGTWVGTLTFKASIDRTNFATLQCTPPNSSSTATTTTGNGQWSCSVAGLAMAEVIFSAYTSGTAVVTLQSALAGGGSGGGGGGAASSVTINDPSVTSQKAAVNASGQLSITCANCSGSGASAVDESTFTQGTNSVAPMGLLFKNAYTALTTGQVGIPQGTSDGALFVNLFKVGGTAIDTNSGTKSAGTVRFVLATDQPNLSSALNVGAAQTGTWTMQPGNTANTTAWKVDGSAVTQPVSGTVALSNSFLLDATYTGRMPAGASPADAESNTNTALSRIGLFHFIFNGTTWDRARGAANALNSTGTGIQTAQIVGQFDDVSPTAITENQFGNLRMSTNRNLYGTIRDAAGNERGANVSAGNALLVDASATTQPISAASLPLPTLAATSTKQSDGSQKTQIVDGSGNVIASTSNNLNVQCANCSGSGVSAADEATFTAGSTLFASGGGFFQTTATSNALTTGQQGAFQVTANRALFSNLRNAAGTEVGTSTTPFQVTLANTGANATAVKVDGSAVTQPVSGTFFQSTQPVSIADGSDTTLGAKADAKSTATDTTAVSIMSVLKEISALEQAPASRAVTNAGTFAAQATLQTQTDTVMVGGVNIKEINAVTPLMGAGATGTGALRVNDVASSATGSAIPASAIYVGGLASGATGGNLAGATACDSDANINISTATTTLLITGVSGRKVHICAINVGPVAGAQNIALFEGTGATCGTGSAGFWGGTTAASGWNFAANGGIAFGSGFGDVATTTTTGDSVCAITSAAVQTSGHIKYAIY